MQHTVNNNPMDTVQQSNEFYQNLVELYHNFYAHWKDHIFLTWRWWVGGGLIVVPWVVWLIVRRKESTARLLFSGMFVMLVAAVLDLVGSFLGLWTYPYKVFPLMPELVPYDLSSLPVATMVFLQYFPKVKPVIKAIVYAGLGAFVFEPLMIWLKLYDNINWPHYFSYPILFAIYLIAHRLAKASSFAPV